MARPRFLSTDIPGDWRCLSASDIGFFFEECLVILWLSMQLIKIISKALCSSTSIVTGMAVSGRYRGLMVRRSMWFIVVQVTSESKEKLAQQGG